MRVSTSYTHDTTVERLQQRQAELVEAQLKLVSGKRVARASDDPSNAARAERALAAVERSTADLRAVEASRRATLQTESALGDATELLQQARELMVASGNETYDDAQRQVLSNQIRGLRSQLLLVANRGDGTGGFLFGGQGSGAPPFLDSTGGVAFVGTRGEMSADRTETLPITMDGEAIWLSAPTGNGVFETRSLVSAGGAWVDTGRVVDPAAVTGSTYTVNFTDILGAATYSVLKDGAPTALTNISYVSGQAIQIDGMALTITGPAVMGDQFEITPSTSTLSVFDTLDKAADDLATPQQSRAAIAQSRVLNLSNLDSVLGRLLGARSTAGAVLNRIDNVSSRLDSTKLAAQTDRSNAEDLDMVAAISDFQNKQSGYDAALKAYASVQRLSLFDFIRT
ncbi:MAG: flagellar hook-associated protein FlgL [Burkholderiaceae bacterium]|nr:flagellar hook-associated protein FlgL [Burkholderiaceae bacterium]MDH3459369.1 flagellar hook-associated protein FlgL [Burkholderiaceae bacterium]